MLQKYPKLAAANSYNTNANYVNMTGSMSNVKDVVSSLASLDQPSNPLMSWRYQALVQVYAVLFNIRSEQEFDAIPLPTEEEVKQLNFLPNISLYMRVWRTIGEIMMNRMKNDWQTKISYKTYIAISQRFIALTEASLERLFVYIDSKKKSDPALQRSVRCNTNGCPGYLFRTNTPQTDDKGNNVEPQLGECKVCSKTQCMDCLIILDRNTNKNHKCDPDLLKTIRLINRDSRPCPNCKEPIFRISGCPQMFCTNCHTAFDWDTNMIMTGRIHNPHYFEWLNKNKNNKGAVGGNAGNNNPAPQQEDNLITQGQGCGLDDRMLADTMYRHIKEIGSTFGFISSNGNSNHQYTNRRVNGRISQEFQLNADTNKASSQSLDANIKYCSVLSFFRVMTHIMGYELNNHRVNGNPVTRFEDLRKRFLRGRISEQQYKSELHLQKKNFEKNSELAQLYEAVVTIGHNIYQLLEQQLTECKTAEEAALLLDSAYTQCVDLARYMNDHSRSIADDFMHNQYLKIVVPNIPKIKAIIADKNQQKKHLGNDDDHDDRPNYMSQITQYFNHEYSPINDHNVDIVVECADDITEAVKLLPEEQELFDTWKWFKEQHQIASLSLVQSVDYFLLKPIEQEQQDESKEEVKKEASQMEDRFSMKGVIEAFISFTSQPRLLNYYQRYAELRKQLKRQRARLLVFDVIHTDIKMVFGWIAGTMLDWVITGLLQEEWRTNYSALFKQYAKYHDEANSNNKTYKNSQLYWCNRLGKSYMRYEEFMLWMQHRLFIKHSPSNALKLKPSYEYDVKDLLLPANSKIAQYINLVHDADFIQEKKIKADVQQFEGRAENQVLSRYLKIKCLYFQGRDSINSTTIRKWFTPFTLGDYKVSIPLWTKHLLFGPSNNIFNSLMIKDTNKHASLFKFGFMYSDVLFQGTINLNKASSLELVWLNILHKNEYTVADLEALDEITYLYAVNWKHRFALEGSSNNYRSNSFTSTSITSALNKVHESSSNATMTCTKLKMHMTLRLCKMYLNGLLDLHGVLSSQRLKLVQDLFKLTSPVVIKKDAYDYKNSKCLRILTSQSNWSLPLIVPADF